MPVLIGLDFDNTIVSYDRVFHAVALELGLIPAELPPVKERIRDYLRQAGREDEWTELQGSVYGPYMALAPPFDGVAEFLVQCRSRGLPVCIVSHRTRYPFLGPKHDLHDAAHRWLESHGFDDERTSGLSRDRVYFELTKAEKLERIARLGCTHFVDDLLEFLLEPEFPASVQRVLFDATGLHSSDCPFPRAASWRELGELVIAEGVEAR